MCACVCVCRFLCGTVNEFVAEVGKAYEKATENKEEADAMAKKVCVCVYVCVGGRCWGGFEVDVCRGG